MSHITKIDLEIGDLDALKAALRRLCPELELKTGQKTYRWYGRSVGDSPIPEGMTVKDFGKCEHAIGFASDAARQRILPNGTVYGSYGAAPYEAGLVKNPAGAGYRLVLDNWQSGYGLCDVIGGNAEKLKQAYAREVSIRTMRRQGYRVIEQTEADGTVRLTCTKPAGR